MILKTVSLQNFRCVKDSGTFKIDENVTCLVGKNESGKTAVLQALNKLNPVIDGQGDFRDLDFPAMQWTEYKARKDTDPAPALSTTWSLEADDVAELTEVYGDSIDYAAEVQISKGYSNERIWSLGVDEGKLVRYLIGRHGLLQDERVGFEAATTLESLDGALAALDAPTQRQQDLNAFLEANFDVEDAAATARELLAKRLPRFVYFADYLRLPGQVSINDLNVRATGRDANRPLRDSDRAYLAYLSLIGATADDLQRTDQFEKLSRELEAASNHLTQKMRKYWSQNRYLRVNCRFDAALSGDPAPFNDGYVARTRIENTRHGVTTSFDDRSAGFVWFFSFLVWFSQVRKEYGANVVILLDEPGLSLHAKAQHDLLVYIEKELSDHQVIYTTHSPFMIDPERLLRARTVEDVYVIATEENGLEDDQDLGTKVGDEILSTDKDTVFPLQACLGYEITQTLFVGKHSLLVEGPSDLLYLKWFQRKLAEVGRRSLDSRWTVTPCGGIDKVGAFVALFGGKELHVAVLTDYARGDKSKIEQLRRSKLLKDGHVLTADTYAGKPEADVEDLMGDAGYVDLVNRAMKLDGAHRIQTPSDTRRIVKWVEEKTRVLPPDAPEFDHYVPAEVLFESGLGFGLVGEADALDRFEKVFGDLNALLP